MVASDWTNTSIWKKLENMQGAEASRLWLQNALPDVQKLLSSAGTAPLSFTLHDDEHSYRVAQRMVDLIPKETLDALTDVELTLLLAAAYLHDIGMNPNRAIVLDIREYLLEKIGNLAGSDEKELLQRWLDEYFPGEQSPILKGETSSKRLFRAEYLTAYYCRHRHNDWSGDYIRSLSAKIQKNPYPSFDHDLINLCKSHHYGLAALKSDSFNAKIEGTPPRNVNLRYLAAVLRVADVIEFDPERTPEIVFEHRAVNNDSIIYWKKDNLISLKLDISTGAIFFSGTTPNARLHKALIETADGVDRELQNCTALEMSGGFRIGEDASSLTHYLWPWQPTLIRNIKPADNSFVYIEGAFRPDTKRLLSILAGTQLYGNPFAAIRELLQNAFDAVREQLARELHRDMTDGLAPSVETRAKLHSVSLKLVQDETDIYLICSDTGAGMTRRVIANYFLVSASKPRPEILELSRLSEQYNIEFDRTGEFGIGALSYFLIADKVVIESTPSKDAYPDAESNSWSFETEGVGAFGELKRISRSGRGSLVKLKLKESLNTPDILAKIGRYVLELVSHIPCRLKYEGLSEAYELETGWVHSASVNAPRLLDEFTYKSVAKASEPAPHSALVQIESNTERWKEIRRLAGERLRFTVPLEGVLPSRRGRFRIVLPYFALENGNSLYFMDLKKGRFSVPPTTFDNAEMLGCSFCGTISWKGFVVKRGQDIANLMDVDHRPRALFDNFFSSADVDSRPGVLLDLDLVRNASVSVDRRTLTIPAVREVRSFLDSAIASVFEAFYKANLESQYCWLDEKWARCAISAETKLSEQWPVVHSIDPNSKTVASYSWNRVKFPAVVASQTLSEHVSSLNYKALKKNGFGIELRPVKTLKYGVMLTPFTSRHPTRIAFTNKLFDGIVLIYDKHSEARIDERIFASMPKNWGSVLAVCNENTVILNRNHVFHSLVSASIWNEFSETVKGLNAAEAMIKISKLDDGFKASFLMRNADKDVQFWNGLRDYNLEAFSHLFKIAPLQVYRGQIRIIWNSRAHGVSVVSAKGAIFHKKFFVWDITASDRINKHVPRPESHWFIR